MVRRKSAHAIYQQRLRNLAKARATKRAIHGGSFFSSIKNGLNNVNNFLKENKFISKGLNELGRALPPQYSPYVTQAAGFADKLGYGRKRRRRTIVPVSKVRSHYRVTGHGVTRVRAHYRMH